MNPPPAQLAQKQKGALTLLPQLWLALFYRAQAKVPNARRGQTVLPGAPQRNSHNIQVLGPAVVTTLDNLFGEARRRGEGGGCEVSLRGGEGGGGERRVGAGKQPAAESTTHSAHRKTKRNAKLLTLRTATTLSHSREIARAREFLGPEVEVETP